MILCGRGWSTCSSWMQVSVVRHEWRRCVTNVWWFCAAVALGLLLIKSFMHCERQRLVKPDCFWASAPLPVRTIQSDLMQIMVRDGERVYFMSTHESWHGLGIGYFVCNMGLSITNLIIIKSPNVGAMLDWLKTRTYRIRPASHESFLHPVRHMSRYTYWILLTIMWTRIQCVLQSILCSRLLLHLHVHTSNLHGLPPVTEFSSIHFTESFASIRFRSQVASFSPPEPPWSVAPSTRFRRRALESIGDNESYITSEWMAGPFKQCWMDWNSYTLVEL